MDESHAKLAHSDTNIHDDLPAVSNTVLEEEEMRKRLTDFESSFLPEPSTFSDQIDGSVNSLPMNINELDLQDTQTTGGVAAQGRAPQLRTS